MSTIVASAPQTPAPITPNYASWGSRVWAATLDSLFNFLLLIPVSLLSLVAQQGDFANYVGFIVSLVYFTLGHGGSSGQTWGKKLAGIRVIRETGEPLGYTRAFLRWATAIGLTIALLIPNLIDVLWPLWDPKKQALRDKVAGSIVIRA